MSQLPIGLRMLLLNTERTSRELEDMLGQRRGLFDDTLQQIPRFTWPPATAQESSQQTCMICLGDFDIGDGCRKLPCRHMFHEECVDEWLRRCTDCPICKDSGAVIPCLRGHGPGLLSTASELFAQAACGHDVQRLSRLASHRSRVWSRISLHV